MKPFGKSEEEINKLLSTVQLLSEEIGRDYKIEKCGVLITKGGKTGCTGGIWVMNKETTKEGTEEGFKYLGILKRNKVKGSKRDERPV